MYDVMLAGISGTKRECLEDKFYELAPSIKNKNTGDLRRGIN
jgi:hypothetical protein